MESIYLNHWAIIVSAAASLVIGGIWYSPILFSKIWQRETGLTDEKLKNTNPAKAFTITFLLSWLMAYNLAFFLGDDKTNWVWGITAGFLAGFGWASFSIFIISLFEMRSWKYMFIHAGYITLWFVTAGFIIGIWR